MRRHATNSPRAAARIVALALRAGGNLHPRQLSALQRLQFNQAAWLSGGCLQALRRDFCENLLAAHA